MLTIFVLLGILSIPIGLWFGSAALLVPKRRDLEDRHHKLLANPSEFGLKLEALETKTADGFILKGFIAEPMPVEEMGEAIRTRRMLARLEKKGITRLPQPRGTVLLIHGRGGLKENMLTIAQRFVAADFRCVVYDQRAHGESEGKFSTYGFREVEDALQVINATKARLEERNQKIGPLFCFGLSMGAAVATQISGRDGQPFQSFVITAPFADLKDVVHHTMRRTTKFDLPRWTIHPILVAAGLRGNFSPKNISPESSASLCRVPMMVVHGSKDKVIPVAHGKRIFENAQHPESRWREVPEGYHGDVLAEGGDDLYQEMIEFFLGSLPTQQG